MSLNLIETLETSIYSPKHTKNTKTHFEFLKKFKNLKIYIFSQKISSKITAFHAISNALIICYVQGHTA